ncbi:MAG: T9SS type A sorting domain-containing protein [Bacteroidetes bacterium]|nr:T9SS type A sorting domain-containing protein [Bacteroidota bacterium]
MTRIISNRITMRLQLIILGIFIQAGVAWAGPGDTIQVQTFTFGSPQEGWFVFPSDSLRFEKIYMLYTLKCNSAQNPACGEWDYLTYTNRYEPTVDSATLTGVSYQVNGSSPDSFAYVTTPVTEITPSIQYGVIYNDTISYASALLGNGAAVSVFPFNTSQPVSRSQYLYKATELLAAGLTAGNITGLQFNFLQNGSVMKNLMVRIKNSALDSITPSQFENTGFTTCFQANTQFLNPGWSSVAFYTPFVWDGISNVVIEITYDNQSAATDYAVASDEMPQTGINISGNDHSAHFNDANYISVPQEAFASVDSQITVSFWFRGDDFLQDRTTFEAYNIYDQRILNVHLPWSDGNIYWDAGTTLIGSYDRIYKHADVSDYESNWHHWAFSKNCAAGSLKIYRDGVLWHSGTGFTRLMNDIKTFWIGSALWNINVSANGNVDEFAVWNTELDEATIQSYLYKPLDENHPNHNNLLVYYPFNADGLYTVKDESGNGFDGSVIGAQLPATPSSELFMNAQELIQRPQVKFEQGVYDVTTTQTVVFDTMPADPVSLVWFADPQHPGVPTDTQLVWIPQYENVYDANGNVVDSVFHAADTTIHLVKTPYNSGPIPVLRRWEIGRYITPYGIGLSLGSDGWMWTYDVSDYVTLLHDSVFLTAGNWQELLDLKFIFIEGTPPRDPLSIQNLWNGQYAYGVASDPIENHLTPLAVPIDADAKGVRLKARVTGHGFGGTSDCAEFCARNHYWLVNDQTVDSRLVWRDNCDLNPLYPQGGTWVYDRANWCPGAEVSTYDIELTPYVYAGDTALLDYNVDTYTWNGAGSLPYYDIQTQLISYGPPNFSLDAEVYDVIQPTTNKMYARRNPICSNPLIVIRNDGAETLTSLRITYGVEGNTLSEYQWTGNLGFLDTAHVRLGAFFAPQNGNSHQFIVQVSEPNGGVDENLLNDIVSNYINFPPEYPSHVYFEFKTNNNSFENDYYLYDSDGNLVTSRTTSVDNTTYKDTITLADGCYTLRVTDTGEDGLSFWANPYQGSGYFRIRNADNGNMVKNFGSDFGGEIYSQFTVGYYVHAEELPQVTAPDLTVYPNPTDGEVWADLYLPVREEAQVLITDLAGRPVYSEDLHDVLSRGFIFDLSDESPGLYLLQVRLKDQVLMRKILLAK